VNVHALVTHFANYHFIFLTSCLTLFTGFAFRAVPVKSIDQRSVQFWYMALFMQLLATLATLDCFWFYL